MLRIEKLGKKHFTLQIAREKRLAERHARMQKQLAEKQARDKAEEEKREAQHDLRTVHRERVEAWKSGKKVGLNKLLQLIFQACGAANVVLPC